MCQVGLAVLLLSFLLQTVACNDVPAGEDRAAFASALRPTAAPGTAASRTPPSLRGEHHVSPKGSASGNGSAENPWDLVSLLAHPDHVKPGDTIWLHAGTYNGIFESVLRGAAGKPIIVRQFPGERAILNGCGEHVGGRAVLTVKGQHAWFWGFGVANCSENRTVPEPGSHPKALQRGIGVDVFGSDIKLLNLVIHDAALGIGCWRSAQRTELYGNIIFFNGWDGPDRAHGHGIYTQNQVGTKVISDNVIFHQYGNGIAAYAQKGPLDDFQITGNVVFMNGSVSDHNTLRYNILVGGETVAHQPLLSSNYTYHTVENGTGGANEIGYSAGCAGLRAFNNYFVGGRALRLAKCDDAEMTGNFFLGDLIGVTAAQYPDNQFHRKVPRTQPLVIVRPNKWEKHRGHVVVYNWPLKDTVTVDVSSLGLEPGQLVRVRNVQDYFAEPLRATYDPDTPLSIPMTGWSVGHPVGAKSPASTFPLFGVFLIESEI